MESPASRRASGGTAERPLGESPVLDAESPIEARPVVLERDDVRDLDELSLIELVAQSVEEHVRDIDGAPRHAGRVIKHELLELREPRAPLIRRELAQLLLADAGLGADRGSEVQTPLAATDHRRPQLGEVLEARRDPSRPLRRELERGVADHHLRVMREDP
jgi:hypothetical protein